MGIINCHRHSLADAGNFKPTKFVCLFFVAGAVKFYGLHVVFERKPLRTCC